MIGSLVKIIVDPSCSPGCEGFLDKDIRRLQEMGNGQTDDENWKKLITFVVNTVEQ